MGNKQSSGRTHTSDGEEMGSARFFRGSISETERVRGVDELWQDCLSLKDGCHILAEAIDDIFEDDDSEETTPELETRLQGLIKVNQTLVCSLTRDLERSAKLVCSRPESNDSLIILVRELVSVINGYMAMLIRNIRKLKRLIMEMLMANPSTSSLETKKLRQSKPKADCWVYDVISDTQDVDAMLIQLQQTQNQREELERDIITVLVCWRDFHSTISGDETEPEIVIAAAVSVALGLAQLSR
ncbi:hypothetical protein PoB_002318100 [Plakobranchus ocellatus]|uniref:Uncharacterized protein n=1 Tax=Plakobranchus ocellatus TaxID=259542 RepID=A0AAV3ZL80_9GAST|nr:hypothetical protein PoB_002318100 [Plakobranchus ocellatus]